ncbi:MAG: enoyl-CoA hydratase/isomerase family protein [Acidobacteriota bacterium]
MLRQIGHGPVRELRLDRPPVNALNTELIAALRVAITDAAEDGAEALVLSGAPGMFSGGLDVPALLQLDRAAIRETWEDFYGLMGALATSPIPVACAITGHSPAGGAVMAMFCDYRVMADGEFKIGLNEVRVGIPMPPAIHAALARLVGPHRAERMVVGGMMISPQEAYRIGFVDELVPLEQAIPAALSWCESLLKLPLVARTKTRAIARADLGALFTWTRGREVDLVANDWFSDETQTALHALVDRLKKK